MSRAERHLIERLVAFFATGDSIVANNLVLNLYKHINAPEARMYLSRQLYEEALHVQFYLTLLDTYVPDPDERATRLRGGREHPVDPAARPSSACAGSTRSRSCDAARHRDAAPPVPAQPDLLRGLHRGAVLLRRLRLRLLPALARPAARPGRRAPTGCSATRARTWRSPSRSCAPCGARSRSCSTPRSSAQVVATMIDEAVECETQFAEDLLRRRRRRPLGARHAPVPASTCADQRLATLGLPSAYGAKNPFASWTCRTCRS